MLVLSRKKGETIVAGEGQDQVHITVVEISGNKVRLGIAARPEISVDRAEVRTRKEQADAASAAG